MTIGMRLGSAIAAPHPAAISFIRSKLPLAERRVRPGNRIYLTRRETRVVRGEAREKLLALMAKHGFREIDPGGLTIRDQVELVSDAEAIAVDAGAACANLMFAPTGAKAFIMGSMIGYTDAFSPLCEVAGVELSIVLSNARVHPKYFLRWTDVRPDVDVDTLAMCLKERLSRS